MKINEMTNLYVGYNESEDFSILICAFDKEEAHEIANVYRVESHMRGEFEITKFKDITTHFDCDYVLMNGQ